MIAIDRQESLDVLKARLAEIDRALSYGEWWLDHLSGAVRATNNHIETYALTEAQKEKRDAFVAKRMLTRQSQRP